MTIEEAKQIKLQDYLHSLGFSPVKQQGDNLWYKSPFRDESEASFKVNTKLNQWYDFGIGHGGNIIALASCLYSASGVSYLLHRIEEQTPHIRPVSFSFRQQSFSEPSFQNMEIGPLSSLALLDYLSGRGINIPLAKRECVEVHFTNNGRRYFAIVFPMLQAAMRYATGISRAVSRRKISRISVIKGIRWIPVICLRDSWITCLS